MRDAGLGLGRPVQSRVAEKVIPPQAQKSNFVVDLILNLKPAKHSYLNLNFMGDVHAAIPEATVMVEAG